MRVEPRILLLVGAALLIPACGGGGSSSQAPESGSSAGLAVINGPEADQAGLGGSQLPLVRIISPTSGASCQEGATVTIQALAADPDTTIARVDFYDGSLHLGSRLGTPYNLAWGGMKAGSHVLTAVAFDVQGLSAVSLPVTVFVTARGSGDNDDVRLGTRK